MAYQNKIRGRRMGHAAWLSVLACGLLAAPGASEAGETENLGAVEVQFVKKLLDRHGRFAASLANDHYEALLEGGSLIGSARADARLALAIVVETQARGEDDWSKKIKLKQRYQQLCACQPCTC